jgi:DNA polymerase-3 subunit gamma/tau
MFENVLHQNVTAQLIRDIEGGVLAPALLFFGPRASGKGTAALELARVLSCEADAEKAAWNCSCPACVRHRSLVSPDLLLLGQKPFYAEIAACEQAWRRDGSGGVKRLFVRSVRKLLSRFSPVLWEDEPKLGKLAPLIAGMEEGLEEFERGDSAAAAGLLKNALALESEGMGEMVPVAQVRKAAYWSRLAPAGKHKCVILENADGMQEAAKNSLLKILEEPPERLTIILSCVRPGTLLPTMLSRLRQYRFVQRNTEEEAGVIRRIFRDDSEAWAGPAAEGSRILVYLESFLPAGSAGLYPLGAYFAASVAAAALRSCPNGPETEILVDLGKFSAPLAEAGGAGRPAPDLDTAREKIFKNTDGFAVSGLFEGFCKNILALLSAWLRGPGPEPLRARRIRAAGIWKTELDNACSACAYNIPRTLVFERLGECLKNALL